MTIFLFFITFLKLVCGKDPRIVGGTEVLDTTTFPYLVAIIMRNSSYDNYYYRQYCGGSIIDESWILTAAHCISTKADQISVLAGTYNLSNMSMGFLRNVSEVYVHEEYNNSTLVNDIALLELEKPMTLSDSVAIITRANVDDPITNGQMYTLAGWGAINMNGTEYDPILNTVEVPAVDLESCSSVLADIYDTNLCAGGVPGEDSCFGDSGGPMSITVNSNEILYGIVSWGLELCATANPAVYTAVAMYQDWIDKNMLGTTAESASNQSLYVIIAIVASVLVVCAVVLVLLFRCYTPKGPEQI